MTAPEPPPRPPPRPEGRAAKRLRGLVMMTFGGLVAALCGSCTAVLVFAGGNENESLIVFPLVIGGIPTAAGVAVFLIGLSVYREGAPKRDDR